MAPIACELRTDSQTEHENLLDDGMRSATGLANELGTHAWVFFLSHLPNLFFVTRYHLFTIRCTYTVKLHTHPIPDSYSSLGSLNEINSYKNIIRGFRNRL